MRPTAVIAVGNQKGGVGKTTNTIQLAGALTERGRRSLIIDLDMTSGATKALRAPTDGWISSFELLTGAENALDTIITNDEPEVPLPPGVHLVPSSRKLLGWTPISVVGPMGRTVEEACLQLAASAGMSPGDPLSYPLDPMSFLLPESVDLSRLRVAYTEDFGACAVDDGIRAVFCRKVQAMKHLFASCDAIDIDLGDGGTGGDEVAALGGPLREAGAEREDQIALRDQLVRRRRGEAAADADRPWIAGEQAVAAYRGGQQRARALRQRGESCFRVGHNGAAAGDRTRSPRGNSTG